MSEQVTIFSDKIFYIENLVEDPYTLLDLISSMEDNLSDADAISKWYSWISSSNDYTFGEKKDFFKEKLSSSSKKVVHIYNEITFAIARAQNIYLEKTGVDLGTHAPICMNKYFTGKMMGPHVDGSPMSTNNPVMSAVLYLNDDYEGGELEFPNQNVFIKPSAGSVILFPSVEPFIHDPKEVISGEKIMCPAFWFTH